MPRNPTRDRIGKDFIYHPPTPRKEKKFREIRDKAKELALMVEQYTPLGRELSLALTKLEEVTFWANAGIAREDEVEL